MIEDATLQATVTEAMNELSTKYGLTARLTRRDPSNGPWCISLNKPGTQSCLIHNVTRGIIAVCGSRIDVVLDSCVGAWLNQSATKINLNHSVLEARFNQRLGVEGKGLSEKAKSDISIAARLMAKGDNPTLVLSIDAALCILTADMFDDEKTIKITLGKIDTFKNEKAAVSKSNDFIGFTVDDGMDTKYPMSISQLIRNKSADARQRLAFIAEKLDTTVDVVRVLCNLVVITGTPNFIDAYHKHLEEDRALLDTLASEDDIMGLLEHMSF